MHAAFRIIDLIQSIASTFYFSFTDEQIELGYAFDLHENSIWCGLHKIRIGMGMDTYI